MARLRSLPAQRVVRAKREARLFAAHGARVVLTDILAEQGQVVAADIGEAACFVLHDVASEADWARVVETALNTFGAVDILVNNAAISRPLKLEHTDLATYLQIVGVNQVGVFLGMRAVLEPMKRAGGGGSSTSAPLPRCRAPQPCLPTPHPNGRCGA
ncbi:MAG: SDR family oxidoreductase [Pseudomonadales bacterium]